MVHHRQSIEEKGVSSHHTIYDTASLRYNQPQSTDILRQSIPNPVEIPEVLDADPRHISRKLKRSALGESEDDISKRLKSSSVPPLAIGERRVHALPAEPEVDTDEFIRECRLNGITVRDYPSPPQSAVTPLTFVADSHVTGSYVDRPSTSDAIVEARKALTAMGRALSSEDGGDVEKHLLVALKTLETCHQIHFGGQMTGRKGDSVLARGEMTPTSASPVYPFVYDGRVSPLGRSLKQSKRKPC